MSTAPDTVTDKKTLADVGKISEMKGLGWSVKDEADGSVTAHENAGDLRSIGPAKNVSALHTMVMLAAGPPVESNGKKKIKAGSSKLEGGEYKENSQPILSGTEDAALARWGNKTLA